MTQADANVELKPCWHCGSTEDAPIEQVVQLVHDEWHPEHNPEGDWWTVQCDNCTATMGQFKSPDEAIDAWNTRVEPTLHPLPSEDRVGPPELYGAVGVAMFKADLGGLPIDQKINFVGNAAYLAMQRSTPTAPVQGDDAEAKWRCFHCDEVFSNRKLAEDHFGQTTLHPAACVDPLRSDERAMRERAMFYERSWREALAQRDSIASLSGDNNAALVEVEDVADAIWDRLPSIDSGTTEADAIITRAQLAEVLREGVALAITSTDADGGRR